MRCRPGATHRRSPRCRRSSSDQAAERRQPGVHQRLQRDPAVGAAIAIVGGILGLVLVRERDFVEPAAPAAQPRSRPRARAGRRLAAGVGGANPSAPAARTGAVLHELRIENLLLIERAELRLGAGPERDHRRDRRRQDGARALARPADGRPGAAADRPAGRRRGLGRGRLRAARRAARRPGAGRARRAAARGRRRDRARPADRRLRADQRLHRRAARPRRPTCGRSARGCSPSTASTSTAS